MVAICIISFIALPVVRYYMAVGIGWVSAILFVVTYLAIIIAVLMLTVIKTDGRTSTGFSGNFTPGGPIGMIFIGICTFVLGAILSGLATMPDWCQQIMCANGVVEGWWKSLEESTNK